MYSSYSHIQRRKQNIVHYSQLIKTKEVEIIKTKKNENDAYVTFTVLCKKRDKLQKYLNKFKIQSLVYYKTPLHLHKATKFLGYKKGDFPIAEKLAKQVLSLPHHQHLKKNEIKFVCKKINYFYS